MCIYVQVEELDLILYISHVRYIKYTKLDQIKICINVGTPIKGIFIIF